MWKRPILPRPCLPETSISWCSVPIFSVFKDAAARHGFRFRHFAGLEMLLYSNTDSAKNAVHLIFSGEKVRPNQATPNPPIAPEKKRIHNQEVMVIPVADLVRMKLS